MGSIGTGPNQIPVAGMLGTMAFQDAESVNIEAGLIGTKTVAELNTAASDAREWTAETVPQGEAQQGVATTRRAWTAQRVFQAIAAWWAASAMKTKLDGIADGATKNATDAQLRDRSTHTGTQNVSTISGLGTAATRAAQTGATDTTAGALMAVGAFGVGKSIRVNAELGVLDLNSLTTPGTYWLDGGIGWLNSPFDAGILVVTGTGGFVQQEALHYLSGFKYVRTMPGNGVWAAWRELLHTGNFDPATKQDKSSIISTATSRTLALTDAWNYVRPGTTSAITLTVPANASAAFEIGTQITIRALGNVTLAFASGVTLNPPSGGTLNMNGRMTVTLLKVGTNEWDVIGQTVAA